MLNAFRGTLYLVLFTLCLNSYSQSDYFPLNRDFVSAYDKFFNRKTSAFHTSIKPYLSSELASYSDSAAEFMTMPFLLKSMQNDTSKKEEKNSDIGVDLLYTLGPGYDAAHSASNFILEGGFATHYSWKKSFHAMFGYYGGNSSFLE